MERLTLGASGRNPPGRFAHGPLALAALAISGAWSCASSQVANPDEQIAQALVAAPEDKAEGARILGYAADGIDRGSCFPVRRVPTS